MQITGILLHADSLSAIKVIKPAPKDPWDLPLTRMDEVLSAYHVNNTSQRVRVVGRSPLPAGFRRGPKEASKSIWIMTQSSGPLRIGDQADAMDSPASMTGSSHLQAARFRASRGFNPVSPRSVTWSEFGNQPLFVRPASAPRRKLSRRTAGARAGE